MLELGLFVYLIPKVIFIIICFSSCFGDLIPVLNVGLIYHLLVFSFLIMSCKTTKEFEDAMLTMVAEIKVFFRTSKMTI